MKKKKNDDDHGPAYQEIMGTIPSRITRYGAGWLLLLLLGILAACWFIRIPDSEGTRLLQLIFSK